MLNRMSKTLAMAAVGGIVAGVAGCGGNPMPLEVPGAPAEGGAGVTAAASASAAPEPARAAPDKAPAEKHSCGGGNGCKSSMMRDRAPAAARGAPGLR